MAVTKIDNQAVTLVTPGNSFQDLNENCNCVGQDFCQSSQPDDTPQFQVDLTEIDGVELVNDGTFAAVCGTNWTCGAGWSIAGNEAILAAGGAGNFTVVAANEINLKQDHQYKVVFTVGSYVGGGSGTLRFGGFAAIDITFTANATVTTFVDMDNLPSGSFFFFGSGGGTAFNISNFSIKEMSSLAIQYKDLDGNIIFFDDTNLDITYDYTVLKAQVLINWNRVNDVNDCYQLCIIDKAAADVDLIVNGDFTVPAGSGWVVVGDWTFPVAVADHAIGVGSFESTLQQTVTINIDPTKCYTLTFTVLNHVAGTLTAYVVLNSGAQFAIGTASANGTFNFDFEFLDGQNILFGTPNDAGDFQIDNVSLVLQDKCKPPLFETECFKLEDSTSCNCASLLLTWTNDENAFGLDYENFTLVQKMRLCAKLYQPRYSKDDKDTYRDSAGNRTLLYSSTTKVERLKMLPMPEYMHDALSIGIEHDTVKIGTTLSPDDTVEYVNDEDEYEPNWTQSLLAPVQLEMIQDDQNLVNSNC